VLKRAYFMTVIDGVFCAWDVRVINRHETRFNCHVWLECDYERL